VAGGVSAPRAGNCWTGNSPASFTSNRAELCLGQQPTLANFRPAHLRARSDEIEFVLQLARLRSRTLRFLRDGVLVGLPALDAGGQIIPMSRLSIYAGQHKGLKHS